MARMGDREDAEVDLVPDWVKLPDKKSGDIARMHRRNMNAIGSAVNYLNPFKRKTVTRPIPPPTGSRRTASFRVDTSRFGFRRLWKMSVVWAQVAPFLKFRIDRASGNNDYIVPESVLLLT